jgi:hypothetical protein
LKEALESIEALWPNTPAGRHADSVLTRHLSGLLPDGLSREQRYRRALLYIINEWPDSGPGSHAYAVLSHNGAISLDAELKARRTTL